MWLPSPKLLLLIAGLLSLCGCGYQPVYKKNEPGGMSLGEFEVTVAGSGRDAFIIEELLQNRLGQAGVAPDYTLSLSLWVRDREIAIGGAGGIDRTATDGTAWFRVHDRASGRKLLSGEVSGSVSWSYKDKITGAAMPWRDARNRLLTQIAERIATRLIASSESWRE